MKKRPFFWSILLLLGVGAAYLLWPQPVDIAELPTVVMVTNEQGETLSEQSGPLWVLLSGVDEHGLLAEHELRLLTAPDLTAEPGPLIHSGVAAHVSEIRQTGPQNLHRFYRVETVTGARGWVSDFYVRRIAYLFDPTGETVSLYAAPGGSAVAQLPNVSPVSIKDPTNPEWWIVQSLEGSTFGWVPATLVKESPVIEYLFGQQHEH